MVWGRLFRSLGFRILGLILVTALGSAGLLIYLLWSMASQIVIEHEKSDLRDDAGLVAWQLLEQVDRIRDETRLIALDKPLRKTVIQALVDQPPPPGKPLYDLSYIATYNPTGSAMDPKQSGERDTSRKISPSYQGIWLYRLQIDDPKKPYTYRLIGASTALTIAPHEVQPALLERLCEPTEIAPGQLRRTREFATYVSDPQRLPVDAAGHEGYFLFSGLRYRWYYNKNDDEALGPGRDDLKQPNSPHRFIIILASRLDLAPPVASGSTRQLPSLPPFAQMRRSARQLFFLSTAPGVVPVSPDGLTGTAQAADAAAKPSGNPFARVFDDRHVQLAKELNEVMPADPFPAEKSSAPAATGATIASEASTAEDRADATRVVIGTNTIKVPLQPDVGLYCGRLRLTFPPGADDGERVAIVQKIFAAHEVRKQNPEFADERLSGSVVRLDLRASTFGKAMAIKEWIERRALTVDGQLIPGAPKVDWLYIPVRCRTALVHSFRLDVDPMLIEPRYWRLTVAAFEEEFVADIAQNQTWFIFWGLCVGLPISLAAVSLAYLWFVVPLQRITRTADDVAALVSQRTGPGEQEGFAEKLRDHATALRLERQDEIGVLARTLEEMLSVIAEQHGGLEEANAGLERRVQERTEQLEVTMQELRVAVEKAEGLASAKDEFVASVSHELRQPLTALWGYVQFMQEYEFEDEQMKEDVQEITKACSRLKRMIEDLLDFQKISLGKMDFKPEEFEVIGLVQDVLSELRMDAKSTDNKTVIDCPPEVGKAFLDRDRLFQVIRNLGNNACKFTRNGTVTFRVRRVVEGGQEWINFDVQDTGRGMTPEEQQQLFQKFVKLSAKAGNKGGTGLGLVICKMLVTKMGGDIGCTSEFGVGTCFTVRLPVVMSQHGHGQKTIDDQSGDPLPTETFTMDQPAQATAEVITAAVSAAAANGDDRAAQVVVIDDDESVRDLVSRHLRAKGFQVHTAADGVEGLNLVRQVRPAVVLLDAVLPGYDGWSVLAALKTDATLSSTPVVMISVMDDPGRGFALGADDFIVKPIEWERLSGLLERYRRGGLSEGAGNVLVLEDDESVRNSFVRLLEREGWQVAAVENGAEGLARLEGFRPDLVMCDLMMPIMNGFEFLKEFRARPGTGDIPVVVVTASELTPEEMQVLRGHAARLFKKSDLNNGELLAELHRQIDRHLRRPESAPAS